MPITYEFCQLHLFHFAGLSIFHLRPKLPDLKLHALPSVSRTRLTELAQYRLLKDKGHKKKLLERLGEMVLKWGAENADPDRTPR